MRIMTPTTATTTATTTVTTTMTTTTTAWIDNGDDDVAEPKQGRPSLAATEATEPMTGDDWESPIRAEIPAALQEASEKYRLARDLDDDYDTDDYDYGNNNDDALEDVQHHFWLVKDLIDI